MKVNDFIGKQAGYNSLIQAIWVVGENGGQRILAEISGWAVIRKLFETEDGRVDIKKAEAFQAKVGMWITDAINEKLEREAKK